MLKPVNGMIPVVATTGKSAAGQMEAAIAAYLMADKIAKDLANHGYAVVNCYEATTIESN